MSCVSVSIRTVQSTNMHGMQPLAVTFCDQPYCFMHLLLHAPLTDQPYCFMHLLLHAHMVSPILWYSSRELTRYKNGMVPWNQMEMNFDTEDTEDAARTKRRLVGQVGVLVHLASWRSEISHLFWIAWDQPRTV